MFTRKLKIIFILSIAGNFLLFNCQKSSNSSIGTDSDGDIGVNNYVLTATGQTKAYDLNGEEVSGLTPGDSLYGQDGHYQAGQPMNYRDNGDGTITDLVTGLMWQKVPPQLDITWEEAQEYCDTLTLAGYDDWRLPTAKELFSISDFSKGWPYLDTNYFKLVNSENISKDEQYWTSTFYVGVTAEGKDNAAFGVNHATGHIKAYPVGGAPMDSGATPLNPPPPGGGGSGNPLGKYVRAVRGSSYGINDFVDNGDSTITDKSTGLMWAKYDSGIPMDWPSALSYAEHSTLAGYDDWRLPNIKELQSIVDYSYSPSVTNPDAIGPSINPIFQCTPITNEAGKKDYGYYWSSTSALFTKGQPYYYAWYLAFGRAVNKDGVDFHGAGAVRFDTKIEGGPLGEGGERFYNFVRLVRNISKNLRK